MKFLKILGIGIAAILGIIFIWIVMISPRYKMERSIVINAAPGVVYDQINTFSTFKKWSPWAAMDTATQYTFEGPESGVGARMSWVSQKPDVGSGSQWIIESDKNVRVRTGISFGNFGGAYFAEFKMTPTAEGTRITWTYESDLSDTDLKSKLMGKVMSQFMEKIMGPMYESGLVKLKKLAEDSAPKPQQ